MFDALAELPRCEAVAGVELGGCPLASAVSLTSFQKGGPLPALYVRKEQKDHGSKRLVEGDRAISPGHARRRARRRRHHGRLDAESRRQARQAGVYVVGVVALVDRLEGGADAIRAAGLPLVSLTTRLDFIPD